MPLRKGKSREIIGENISEMIQAGQPRKQAIAASLSEARKSGAKIPIKHKDSEMKHTAEHKEHHKKSEHKHEHKHSDHKHMHEHHKEMHKHHLKEIKHHEKQMAHHEKHLKKK